MPSFTFFTSRDKNEIQSLGANAQCIVPDGFEGNRGELRSACSHLKWRNGTHAPVEHYKSNDNGYAFLIGEAIAEDTDNYLTASELFEMVSRLKNNSAVRLSRFSGFFAWIVILDDETVYCGSDPFGFFPVYYFHGKHSLGIATSLNALHAHPEYDKSVDPAGFCRYILENGCSSHRTLEKSGKRLNIAESICYDPKSGKLRNSQHPLPGENVKKTVYDSNEAIQLSADSSIKAVERHTQRSIDTCMLSGGLDSRHVLSIAHRLGHRPICLTTGIRHTYETINARRVARKLGLPWECILNNTVPPQKLLDDEMNTLSLGGGFNSTPMSWEEVETIRCSRYLTGLLLDITYAPNDPVDKDPSFGSYQFAQDYWIHGYGVIPSVLEDILTADTYKDGFQAAIEEVRSEWEALSENPIERHWQTIARYRARAHHGGITWKNAFYNWPVIPALDVPLTEAIRSVDGQLMFHRKLQNQTFIALDPELAAIPLVSVSAKPRPLRPTKLAPYYKKMERLERRFARFKRTYLKPKSEAENSRTHCWKIAQLGAFEQLDTVANIFDIDKVKTVLFHPNDKKQDGLSNRERYSQRLLSAGINWLANQ
ncbi:MAG: asparagine synthase-related protein [Opitutaceae bacterium]